MAVRKVEALEEKLESEIGQVRSSMEGLRSAQQSLSMQLAALESSLSERLETMLTERLEASMNE